MLISSRFPLQRIGAHRENGRHDAVGRVPEPGLREKTAGSRTRGTRGTDVLPKEDHDRRNLPMKLKDIMTPQVEVTDPGESLYDAARKMRSHDIGVLPVCDGERLVGMLTDRDVTIRSVAEGRDPRQTHVKETMTPSIAYCFDDQDAEEAERVMQEQRIRRLPVLDRQKHLVGIVSLGDLATKVGGPHVADTLEKVSEPSVSP